MALKRLSINFIALALATFIGLVATTQAAYMFHVYVGRQPMGPWVLGFLVSLIVAAVAPRTAFLPRFLVFTGIFLAELALSIIFANAMPYMVNSYWGGNVDAAKPWIYGGVFIPIINCVAGILALRRFRSPKPTDIDVDWAR
ncbi:hypothetical protein [Mesorhizobium sp. INR15]|uniref:hypothetical protein n=1 Tax=Mesorhizobium sp. INR15 TaxID=2654248 RepID=UPI0018965562|nr:hypothetical protein [Mesorhizobium sp. INR15]QPC91885.1 hypothetical protein GA829_15540 [Mesorhizobium sp. INR15]